MSDMFDFGADDNAGEPSVQQTQGPKWFRDYMDKVSGQLNDLKAENDRLKAETARQEVRNTVTAQGYAPQVADLYTGKPEGLNDWLGTYGAAFAKAAEGAEGGQGQAQQGPPATVVSPESQQAMAAFSAAGATGAPALSGEDALAARLDAAQTPEEFNAIMREAGNVRFR